MIRSCLKRDNQLFWQIIDWSPMMIELVLKVFCIYIECFEGVLHEFYKDNLFFEFRLKETKFKWCSLEEIIKSWFAVLPWISKSLEVCIICFTEFYILFYMVLHRFYTGYFMGKKINEVISEKQKQTCQYASLV